MRSFCATLYILLIFDPHKGDVSGSYYIALNRRMTGEQRIGKDVEGNCHGLIKVQLLNLHGRRGKSQRKPKRYLYIFR